MAQRVTGALALLVALSAGASEVTETLGGVPYRAVLSASQTGLGGDVKIYATLQGKPYMIFTHPSPSDTPRLEQTFSQDRFPDFFKDGSRALVYRMVNTARGRSTLHVLRFQKGRFARAGAFPEGTLRDFDADGRLEIVTRSAPLGRLATVSCARFETTVAAAMKTDIMRWEGGRFVSVAGRYPAFFEQRLLEGERALAALEPEKSARAGEYVGLALTLYYDYAAAGQARRGWERLSFVLDPKISLPGAADCVAQIKADLRSRLSIPDDWP